MSALAGENDRTDLSQKGEATPRLKNNFKRDPLKTLRAACEEVAKAEPGDVQKIASLHATMILDYYQDVPKQAQQSFVSALVAAAIGTLFFLSAAWPMTHAGSQWSNVGLIAGGVIQVISGINF
jgi:hypothetical protein